MITKQKSHSKKHHSWHGVLWKRLDVLNKGKKSGAWGLPDQKNKRIKKNEAAQDLEKNNRKNQGKNVVALDFGVRLPQLSSGGVRIDVAITRNCRRFWMSGFAK